MARPALALLVVLSVTSAAAALDYSAQLQREYTDRLLTVDDTAPAHVALAKWCDAVGLKDKARTHWQEALHRDADHKEARAALGFVRRGLAWVQATEAATAAPAPGAVQAQAPAMRDPDFARRRGELTRRIRDISVQYLGTTDPERRREGREKILAIRDPAAAEPIVRILGAGNLEMRQLACEALGRIPGQEAARYLVKYVLTDPSRPLYEAAVKALASRTSERGLPQLLNALNGSEKVLQRSAYALGEMREWRAVPALINHLRTQEPRVKTYDAPREKGAGSGDTGAYFFSGTVSTYVKDVEPVVAEGAVGWDPTIGSVPSGAMISIGNPSVRIHRTVIEFVRQPAVHEALKKITDEDFEFDTPAWRDWLRRRESDAGAATRVE